MTKIDYSCKNDTCGVTLKLDVDQLEKANYLFKCPKCKVRQKIKKEDLQMNQKEHPPGWLMIHDENVEDQVYTLIKGDNVFGRKPGTGPGCHTIDATDTYLSRKHCGIQVVENKVGKLQYLMQDLKSTNGTFLNAEPRKYNHKDIIYLRDNDLIQMGRTKFIFIKYEDGRTAKSVFDELAQTSFRNTVLT